VEAARMGNKRHPHAPGAATLSFPDVVRATFDRFQDDKATHPAYSRLYSKYLANAIATKGSGLRLLEIGVGCVNQFSYGNGTAYTEGRSVQVWKSLLPLASITVADIDACALRIAERGLLPRDAVFVGSQTDVAFLDSIIAAKGPFDIVVDDASHVPAHQKETFFHFVQHGMRPGGVYVVEDIESSHYFDATLADHANSLAYMAFEVAWALTLEAGRFPAADAAVQSWYKNKQVFGVAKGLESVDWFPDAVVFQMKA
jgi:hypothetical protein